MNWLSNHKPAIAEPTPADVLMQGVTLKGCAVEITAVEIKENRVKLQVTGLGGLKLQLDGEVSLKKGDYLTLELPDIVVGQSLAVNDEL